MNNLKRREDCRLCHSSDLELALSLEPTTIADHYIAKDDLDKQQEKFPLDLYLCNSCSHLQMLDFISPEILFRNYVFETSSSRGLIDHFRDASEKISAYFQIDNTFILEIGSNDGSMLRFFRDKGCRVLGIDPAREIARKATESGIETLPEFFNLSLAGQIKQNYGLASAVIANNVFAHVNELEDVVHGVRKVLSPQGIFTFEVSYLPDIVDKMLFDTIYHEHLSYHSLSPLIPFFKRNGLELFDTERITTKGGSIRGFVQLDGEDRKISERLTELLENEKRIGLTKIDYFKAYEDKINTARDNVAEFINGIKKQGKSIAGYGISPTANTLLYHFRLGECLDFIVDDNPSKQGLYTAGHHIPILSSAELNKTRPDYTIILAWNYSSPIKAKNKEYLRQGGRFIIPLPELKID